ncbi:MULTISPECIES: hypothetical protein [Alphaproteobacteria]|uniref:hypothetical protein n=2 Tax=Pseudomonadota TaxID=1224 RepID=UPI003265E9BC
MVKKDFDYYFINSSPYTLEAQAENADGSYALSAISVPSTPLITEGSCEITFETHLTHSSGDFQFRTDTLPPHDFRESINPLTKATSGPLEDMMQTPSVIGSDFSLSYGMFDAGSESGTGLTGNDQIYAYLTPSQQNWMGTLAAAHSDVRDAPFASFALPGAHDAGTFDLAQVDKLLSDAAAHKALTEAVTSGFSEAGDLTQWIGKKLKHVIVGEAVTQKDNVSTMLDLGCRYFDFRPGHVLGPFRSILPDLYHIHTLIPGQTYKGFIKDVLTWLLANPTEIVAVHLSTSGFLAHSTMDPTTEELKSQFMEVQQTMGAASIQIGSAADLQTSYSDLVKSNRRLFFLNQPSLNWFPATSYGSYNSSYETTDPQIILNALGAMTESGQSGKDFAVLSLQATATGQNKINNVIALLRSLSKADSPLMSTKPMMDCNTYPWLLDNVCNLRNDNLLALPNDFVDNALAGSIASVLTLQRCSH